MKRLLLKVVCVAVTCGTVLGGCAAYRSLHVVKQPTPVAAPVKATEPELVDASGATITRMPFRPGVSSVTVENMAKQKGCTGGVGAGLMTPPGPVEVYRMICDNRSVYTARCELRQCKAM